MFRRTESSCILAALVLVALLTGSSLSAQSKPSSDLLLSYVEVDLAEGGTTTLFAVSNTLNQQVDLLASIRTNWGIEVLSVPVKLKAKELWTVDLRDWLVDGDLPGEDLTEAELAHLQAALTGQPSPSDGLYYAATSAHATGSITFRTQGNRPNALRGESFLVDPDQGTSPGQPLADVDRVDAPHGGCLRQSVRHVSGSGFGRSQITLWMATAGTPQPASGPEDRRQKVTASVFSASGALLKRQQLRLLPVDKVTVSSLGLTQALGRIVLVTETESIVGVQPAGRAVFQSSCGNASPTPTKPAIQLETQVKNQDADTAPGPSIAVGVSFNWQYQVSNAGVGALTFIAVTDGDGDAVKCPKTILQPGESMTCRAKDVAVACQQRNAATATARSKQGTVTSQDAAYYFGSDGSEISIELLTNGEEVEDEIGPSVEAGTVVSWSYLVTNSGTLRLYDIEVADSREVTVTCPEFSLAPGAVMTCTAQAVATAGQYTNTGTATAVTSCGTVSDSATSHYLGVDGAGLGLVVELNGSAASSSPGPTLAVGTPLTWEYTVGNSGDLAVYDVDLSDDQGNTASCPDTSLESGDSMVCLVRGVAAACQVTVAATVTGETALGGELSAAATTYYVGQETAAVSIDTTTNGSDGPTVAAGAPVIWTYVVTNLGKVPLSAVEVSDNRKVTVACPQSDLRPGESMTCEASGIAVAGDYSNTGTVTANDPCGVAVTDQDSSSYVGEGSGSALALRMLLNGEEAPTAPGPTLEVGDPVLWSYVVTNAGQTPLTEVAVTDDKEPAVSCPKTSLLPAESMTCLASGSVQEAGQYSNIGTATAKSLGGLTLTATATSYYFGEVPEAEASLR
jgi:hypothetical protein